MNEIWNKFSWTKFEAISTCQHKLILIENVLIRENQFNRFKLNVLTSFNFEYNTFSILHSTSPIIQFFIFLLSMRIIKKTSWRILIEKICIEISWITSLRKSFRWKNHFVEKVTSLKELQFHIIRFVDKVISLKKLYLYMIFIVEKSTHYWLI